MPAPASVEDFLELVRKSCVVEDARLRNFEQSLLSAANATDSPNALAQRMVREGLITSFQAKQLLHGKWKRFMISGKYKLLELLGAGGMGAVYLCEHVFLRKLVALKVLPVDKIADPGAIERFYREAHVTASLDHPNIVRAHDIDQDEKIHFLVMEYIDGASLQQIVSRNGRMDWKRAANYIRQAAEGLQYAHENQMVHRDIKPGNLLLERDGTLKILDLGLAKFFGRASEQITEKFDENCVLGTADYLAPEQAMGGKLDIRADIYSLGATFYFLLTGKAPFEEGSVPQKLVWHQTKQPAPVTQYRADVPEKLLTILNRMMEKNPEDRFQTPKEVSHALAEFAAATAPPPDHEMPQLSLAATSSISMSTPVVPKTPLPNDSRHQPMARAALDKARSTTLARVGAGGKSGSGGVAVARRTGTGSGSAGDLDLRDPYANPTPGPITPLSQSDGRPSAASNQWIYLTLGGGVALIVALLVIIRLIYPSSDNSLVSAAPNTPLGLAARQPKPNPAAPPVGPLRPDEPPITISVDDAVQPQYFGKRVQIEFVVASTGRSPAAPRFFLNSKNPYVTPGNFAIVIDGSKVVDQLNANGITDLLGMTGKKVRVIGTITRYRDEPGKPQIVLEDATYLEIID